MTVTRFRRFRLQLSKNATVVGLAEAILQVASGEHPEAFEAVLVEAADAALPQEATAFSFSEQGDRS